MCTVVIESINLITSPGADALAWYTVEREREQRYTQIVVVSFVKCFAEVYKADIERFLFKLISLVHMLLCNCITD